jgi:hypothetical protein
VTRRSPSNERYGAKKPKGSTSTSAARAKPKRDAGEAAGGAPSKKRGGGTSARRPGRDDLRIEATPEMKRLRLYWGIALGVAFVLATIAAAGPWIGMKWVQTNKPVSYALLVGYVIALGIALWLDMGPLKKARKAAVDAAKAAKKGRS